MEDHIVFVEIVRLIKQGAGLDDVAPQRVDLVIGEETRDLYVSPFPEFLPETHLRGS